MNRGGGGGVSRGVRRWHEQREETVMKAEGKQLVFERVSQAAFELSGKLVWMDQSFL